LKDRYVSVFGNKSWSGGGVSGINAFVEEIGWERIGESIEATYSPKDAEFKALTELGEAIAVKLHETFPETE
jgi:flavorubredoxin